MLFATAGNRAVRRVGRRGRISALRADAARRAGPAPDCLRAGARPGLDGARTDAQPPFARGHLRADHPSGRGGGKRVKIFWTLLRRELTAFFFSLTGYVIIAAVTLLVGLGFVVLIAGLGNDPFTAQVTEMFYGLFYFWLILLVATPVITMRLFALEKSSGTFETLITTPVG